MVYSFFILLFRRGKKTIHRQEPRLCSDFYVCTEPGGMNIIDILRSLSKSESTYGEVSREVDVILRDMDYFGSDLKTALYNLCEVTPSEKLKDLMYNLLTVIDSGGNIPTYFRDKSEQYLNAAKIEQKGFLETLV